MKNLCIVAGTRPNLIKAAPLISAGKELGLNVMLVDTNQHYDHYMQRVFYEEYGLPDPYYNIPRVSEVIIVIGDTNSTVTGALSACKNGIPLAHVEAGCRCWDKTVPEEVNRIVVDGLSDFLFCPTVNSQSNVSDGIFVGDVLYDVFLKNAPEYTGVGGNVLMTIHREENTRDDKMVKRLIDEYSEHSEIIFPAHPRTRRLIGSDIPENVHVIDPVSHNDLLRLLSRAENVVTDSGGLYREAYWMGAPCVIVRESHEWPECEFPGNEKAFGDGDASETIMRILADA